MIDSLPLKQLPSLTTRIVQGMFNMYCAYLSLKYFPLVFVTLVANLAPLLVALFAYLLYRETLSAFDIGNLLISFLGVAILITGSFSQEANPQSQTTYSSSELILPAILLVTFPFNQCSIQLLLRNMRSLNEQTITAWMTLAMLLVFIPVSYINKPASETSAFYFMAPFSISDWVLCALFGVAGVYSQTTRAKAVHYEESAKLSVLLFF